MSFLRRLWDKLMQENVQLLREIERTPGHLRAPYRDQIFWSSISVAAGSAPQVARDFWSRFFVDPTVHYDISAVLALVIFGGAIAVAVVHYLFWWDEDEPSSADLLVQEIRNRSNITRRVVSAVATQPAKTDQTP